MNSQSPKSQLDRRQFIRYLGGVITAFGIPFMSCTKEKRKPNVILIYSDDHGYGDLGCYGADDLLTPNIDRLCENGIKMTNFYSCSPVCSPARAGLLTGRYPDRTGVLGVLRRQHDDTGMDLNEITLAKILTENGYVTGLYGKWHLGVGHDYRPRARGFQETFGPINGMIDYYTHIGGGGLDGQPSLYRNDDLVEEEGYFTELVNKEALAFLDRHQNDPFFLFLPYTAPHAPLQAPDKYLEPFKELAQENPKRALYAAMLYCMDEGIGKIMDKVERLGLSDNTVIVFLSDQGWVQNTRDEMVSSNGGLSRKGLEGGKYYLTEGGIKVPCIFSIPGYSPGISDVLGINLDLFTTICSFTHSSVPQDRVIDGIDLLPYLKNAENQSQRTLFWRFQDNWVQTGKQWAVRQDQWKLIHIHDKTRLYNIHIDPAETKDLADQHPNLVKELETKYRQWIQTLPDIQWQSRPDDI